MQSCRRSLNANSFNGMLRDITCRSHGVHVMTTAEVREETDTEARIEKRASRTHRYCRQFLESIKGTSTDMTKVESLDFCCNCCCGPIPYSIQILSRTRVSKDVKCGEILLDF